MEDGLVQNQNLMSLVPTKEIKEFIGKLLRHNGNRQRLSLNGNLLQKLPDGNLLQQFPDGNLLQQRLTGRRKLPPPNLSGEEKRPLLQIGDLKQRHHELGGKVTTTMKKITLTKIRKDGINQHLAL